MTDAEWSDLEQEYADEQRVRGYLVACIEQAHRSQADLDRAVHVMIRARLAAEAALDRCRRDQELAIAQIALLKPLLDPPHPTPILEAATVRA